MKRVRFLAIGVLAIATGSLVFWCFLPVPVPSPLPFAQQGGDSAPEGVLAVGIPAFLRIPRIHVDAAVEGVGQTAMGAMAVPKELAHVGWYALGPRPGMQGSAVIDGHVNDRDGAPAVFADLHTLVPGDLIFVEDDQGFSQSFLVRESRLYRAEADATDVFVSPDTGTHLHLITCAGAWNEQVGHYTKRLVVFADLVPVLSP